MTISIEKIEKARIDRIKVLILSYGRDAIQYMSETEKEIIKRHGSKIWDAE